MTRREAAEHNFTEGYNCTQSVIKAFSDLIPMEEQALISMVSPLGGGMGRLREVCGAVSGMFLVLGALYGYADPQDKVAKAELYREVQELAASFEAENGSIVCRELLGLSVKKEQPVPEDRTAAYYAKRPCKELVGCAAALLEEFIRCHPQ